MVYALSASGPVALAAAVVERARVDAALPVSYRPPKPGGSYRRPAGPECPHRTPGRPHRARTCAVEFLCWLDGVSRSLGPEPDPIELALRVLAHGPKETSPR